MNVAPHLLPALVQQSATQDPDRVVLRHVDGTSITAAEFYRACLSWAAAFEARGVREAHTVVVMLPPSFEALEAWMGLAYVNAVEVPINTAYKGRILQHVLSDSRAATAVVSVRYLPQFLEAATATGRAWEIWALSEGGRLPDAYGEVGRHSIIPAETLLTPGSQPSAIHTASPGETSCILYTSGTTGPSKGVVVPWEQQYATARGVLPLEQLGPSDVYYSPFPTFHISGKFAFYCMMIVGGHVVIREQYKTECFWDDVRRFGCTTTMLLGAMVNFIHRQPPRADDHDNPMKNVLMIPVIPEVEQFKKRFDVRVCTVFNMTEVSCPLTSDAWELGPVGSCGKVRPGYDVRLVDAHDREVAIGEMGELVVRADRPWTLMNGYWQLPEKTVEAWRNLWLHTGDAFYRDADGHFFFVDRMKDAIRRRGENISSAEVEAEILDHPQVRECAVVAVPSEWGEDEILAVVVADGDLTEQALWQFCEDRLPRFMTPRYIRFAAELPKTPTSKIRKVELREAGVTAGTFDATRLPGRSRQ